MADGLWDLARPAEPGSDIQLQAVRAFCGFVRSAEHVEVVRGLLDGTLELPGLTVDTDLRWDLVGAVAGADEDGSLRSEELVDAELARDDTASGQRAAAAALRRPARRRGQGGGVGRGSCPATCPTPCPRRPSAASPAPRSRSCSTGSSTATSTRCCRCGRSAPTRWRSSSSPGCTRPRWCARTCCERGDAWLAAHPDAPGGLRRLVLENRDGTARALRAHARDLAEA